MTELEKEYEEKHQEWLKVLIPVIENKENHYIIRRLAYNLDIAYIENIYPDLRASSAACFRSICSFQDEQEELEKLQELLQKHGDKFKNGEIVL